MKQNNFSAIRNEADSYDEGKDCVVIALAVVCELPYKEIHAILSRAGRRNGKGTDSYVFDNAKRLLEDRGYKFVEQFPRYEYSDGHLGMYTMKTIMDVYPKGNILCQISGHQAAVIDGKVIDWTSNRMHRVTSVWVVTK